MARPTSSPRDRRTQLLKARCSPTERERIEQIAKAVKLTVSDYLRTAALNAGYTPDETPAYVAELIFELNKIGVNLNQIAHKLNATGQIIPADHKAVQERLNGILDEVQGLGPQDH